MMEFLQYWTAADYVLLAVLITLTIFCLVMAIRAEAAIKRNQARMTPEELKEHNAAMQRALKQWEQTEHEVRVCSLYLEYCEQARR